MIFSQRLRQLRIEKNLTQDEFAKDLGYTRTAISAWEIGRNEPSNDDTVKIANYFHVTTDYLLGNTDVKDPGNSIDDILNESMIGISKEDFEKLSDEDKQELRNFAIYVRDRNKIEKKANS